MNSVYRLKIIFSIYCLIISSIMYDVFRLIVLTSTLPYLLFIKSDLFTKEMDIVSRGVSDRSDLMK